MASLLLTAVPTTTAAVATLVTSASNHHALNTSFFAKSSRLSIYRNQPQHFVSPTFVSCNASNNNKTPQKGTFDRRNMLLSLGAYSGAAAALTMVNTPASFAAVDFPKVLDSVIRTTVKRPHKSRSKEEKAAEEEVIVVDVQVSHGEARMTAFDVYINYDGEVPQGAMSKFKKEYAGGFSSIRHNPRHKGKMDTSVRLGLNTIIEDLNANDDENLQVTLVPRSGQNAITINDVRIEYMKN